MIELNHDMMEKLALKSSFRIERGPIVLFGIRGMLPVDVFATDFAASRALQPSPIDHRFMRCTIGQWMPEKGTLAVFPGSTVPHIGNVQRALARRGSTANMLMLGKYLYAKGRHKHGKPGAHRAFRQARFFPVWRTADDLDFEHDDIIDNDGGTVWDNLHCAGNNNLDHPFFGSAGCQVVAGLRGKPDKGELGPWKAFVDSAYMRAGKPQGMFEYMLFSGFEVARLAQDAGGRHNRTCRYGSYGPYVVRIQRALARLGFPGFLDPAAIDGDYGRNTLEAVVAFQNRQFGEADGIVGPLTAAALDIAWDTIDFAPNPATPAPSAPDEPAAGPPLLVAPDPVAATGIARDWFADAVKVTCGFENAGDPYRGVTGNFDGQGISCGAMQWNLGQGSLQPMIRAVGKPLVLSHMPQFGEDMWKACTATNAAGVTMAAGWHRNNRLPRALRDELSTMLGSGPMRAEQDKAMAVYAERAMTLAEAWAAARGDAGPGKRAFMWFFDTVCQNGSMKGLGHADVVAFIGDDDRAVALGAVCASLAGVTGSGGHVRDAHANAQAWADLTDPESIDLLVLSFLRAAKSLPRWRHVVLNRKGTIAAGHGDVNSGRQDLGDYGI